MDSTILSIIEKRKLLNWSAKKMAEKANVSFSAVLRMEQGKGMWPDYLATIEGTLDEEIKKSINKYKQGGKYFLNKIKAGAEADKGSVTSKYQVCINEIDIKTYFPNLDRGEIKRLFGERRKSANQESKITPTIKFRKFRNANNRLQQALDHANELVGSFPKKKKRSNKEKFIPNFNAIACRWFEEFDNVNNTNGFHATSEGEFYIEELGFFPDYFNPQLKLIMEWDEAHHYTKKGELFAKDHERQKAIQDLFPDYQFIRIKEDDFKEYLDLWLPPGSGMSLPQGGEQDNI